MYANRQSSGRQVASTRSHTFDMVAIGASAGGVEVLRELLAALPGSFAPAVMIVMHLVPDVPSYLVQTFSYRSALPVIEPDAGERILAGRIHVAPPGYHMLVENDRTVALSTEAAVRHSRPSIDVLFESAAWVYRERLLGILLSGANDDGVHGLATVRAMGGLAWVQTPETAASPEMPRAAIERGVVDEVLSPPIMARRLARLPAVH
ncbi:Protein-glutamate methylesterase/protein-glutamine glutaminase 2 [Paraburkholderia gardini]|uniref:protein-glutamate methylesterase n=2 Tax=Paraburkholderia gardini TaxID=2823469 RepID=A0ABM8U8S8_9BURK|nr:chemotaxis protein CheB [Paraburkholderia gardini]CAG4895349.1 Protein-glutamate methylesterase/protein-glutamine glutaminase 2 [Paraburkholderia gardini]CAG4915465.1 Protein-glutamate methylesterase/protein-glutamine glutaminase 2 [Paraburkholderia gardini]